MKKNYIAPTTETVNIRLYSSVMDKGHIGRYSDVAAGGDDPGFADAKENNFLWEDDLWDDGDSNPNPYDLWGEN